MFADAFTARTVKSLFAADSRTDLKYTISVDGTCHSLIQDKNRKYKRYVLRSILRIINKTLEDADVAKLAVI